VNVKLFRIGSALALLGFLFVFFVPVIYDATMFQCSNPQLAVEPFSGYTCLTNPSGLKSIGYALFHWGAGYSFGGGGDPQLSGYTFLPDGYFPMPDGSRLSTFGVLLFLALPMTVAGLGLLGPEIVKKSKVTRAGFVIFGAFVFALAALVALFSSPFNLGLALLFGGVLAPIGGVMVLYGLHRWMFRLDYTT
jgi:hypothetical protein